MGGLKACRRSAGIIADYMSAVLTLQDRFHSVNQLGRE